MNGNRSKPLCTLACLIIFAISVLSGCGNGSSTPTSKPISFSPSSGAVGTLVTITGTDFSTTQSVSIGGVAAVSVSQTSSTLVAFVMPGASTGPVSVTTPDGSFAGNGNFTVIATGVPANQQGNKLLGTGAVGAAWQGASVAVSADGNTAIIGGPYDDTNVGAAWVFTRSDGTWTQQGEKLVGSGASGSPGQGWSVALSADGNTVLIGNPYDDNQMGATWVFTRSSGTWTQQGDKLVGTGTTTGAWQGESLALSADGNTALIGGPADNDAVGAAWVFTRSDGIWTQQGNKLVGNGVSGNTANQGYSVALSADGNTAIVGGPVDNSDAGYVGAIWVFTRTDGTWTQQGNKLVGTGYATAPEQGYSVAVSADGNTALVGGFADFLEVGAAWVFTRSNGSWTQQGSKLVGSGYLGPPVGQGTSLALSADGNTAFIGGRYDDPYAGSGAGIGAAWVFTRSTGTWTQQGSKLVGSDYSGTPNQGFSAAISSDGNTALLGGLFDNSEVGAAWVFTP